MNTVLYVCAGGGGSDVAAGALTASHLGTDPCWMTLLVPTDLN
jgi:hypothetical protein